MSLAMFTDVATGDYEQFRVGLGGLLASTEHIATINSVAADALAAGHGFTVDDGSSPDGGTGPALAIESDTDSRNTRVVFWARVASDDQSVAYWKAARRVLVTLNVTTSTGRTLDRAVVIEARQLVTLDAA